MLHPLYQQSDMRVVRMPKGAKLGRQKLGRHKFPGNAVANKGLIVILVVTGILAKGQQKTPKTPIESTDSLKFSRTDEKKYFFFLD